MRPSKHGSFKTKQEQLGKYLWGACQLLVNGCSNFLQPGTSLRPAWVPTSISECQGPDDSHLN
uniref:Uncharacterized protein n=1 Tax=Arundo donax TaxID=35708 RepID=A0A0A9BLL5_ARUDO